jgi:CubicO group peptidase (beta-lactamase class C family)
METKREIAVTFLFTLAVAAQIHPVADIDTIVGDGIRAGVFPGAVVAVGTGDTVLFAKGYGHMTWSAETEVPSPEATLYDLASLTKVVATTPAVMVLVDRGSLDLDRPVRNYLDDFVGEGKEAVTVRHLLEHTSGLRAFLPLNTLAGDAEAARRLVVTERLRWPVGSRTVYSDLNAMLLGWIVESASGLKFDAFLAREVFQPLGMNDTQFRLTVEERSRAAPINVWRGHVIRGVVHDQNAERLDGVSGHAGLFSTGLDLARYARLYLDESGAAGRVPLVRSETAELFMSRRAANRGYGWQMRDTTTSDNAGELMSARAFGHGGFTGTSLWIDPELNVFVILLTNRVFSPRTRRSITKLKEIRGLVADAAVRLAERSCRLSGSAAC